TLWRRLAFTTAQLRRDLHLCWYRRHRRDKRRQTAIRTWLDQRVELFNFPWHNFLSFCFVGFTQTVFSLVPDLEIHSGKKFSLSWWSGNLKSACAASERGSAIAISCNAGRPVSIDSSTSARVAGRPSRHQLTCSGSPNVNSTPLEPPPFALNTRNCFV